MVGTALTTISLLCRQTRFPLHSTPTCQLNLLDKVTRGLVPRPVSFQGVFIEALSAVTEIIIVVPRSRCELLLIGIWFGIPQLGLRVSGAHTCITGRLRVNLEGIQNGNETFTISLRFFGLGDEIIPPGARAREFLAAFAEFLLPNALACNTKGGN